MIRYLFVVLYIFFFSIDSFSQDKFSIIGGQESYAMSFELMNNLIIIPIEVNGNELNFLLDTGVNNSIMFNLDVKDSLKLKNVQKVRLRGLGEGNYLDAFKSSQNLFRIGKIVNGNHMIYLIPGKEFDLSSNLGVNINGIIGGDLFQNFIIEVNYSSKRIKFFDPNKYVYGRCKKCETFDLDFYKDKPYINIMVQNKNSVRTKVKLLIDSGGGDALWLFEKSDEGIIIPEKSYDDYLGKGLSGNVYGKRGKIDKVLIGKYFFSNVNVAYPDFSSIEYAYRHKERNGSLGSEILKRFRIVFDYHHKKITFKKKSSYYNDPFLYNMSGLQLSYSGDMLVRERKSSINRNTNNDGTSSAVEIVYNYVYAFKKSYQIVVVRKDSPGHRAGLLIGDIVLQINGKPAYNYKLQEITHMLSSKEGKQIKLLIDRDGKVIPYTFRLEKML